MTKPQPWPKVCCPEHRCGGIRFIHGCSGVPPYPIQILPREYQGHRELMHMRVLDLQDKQRMRQGRELVVIRVSRHVKAPQGIEGQMYPGEMLVHDMRLGKAPFILDSTGGHSLEHRACRCLEHARSIQWRVQCQPGARDAF